MTSLFVLMFAVLVVWTCTRAYVKVKGIGNGVVAVSTKAFHEAVDELVKAGDVVPDVMLKTLQVMNRTAFARRSNWHMYRVFRLERKGVLKRQPSVNWHEIVSALPPEVADQFNRAVVSWTNIMIGRNPLIGLLIANEILRRNIDKNEVPRREDGDALRVLPQLCAA